MYLSDRVIWLMSVYSFLPKFHHNVVHPLLIWASKTSDGNLQSSGYRQRNGHNGEPIWNKPPSLFRMVPSLIPMTFLQMGSEMHLRTNFAIRAAIGWIWYKISTRQLWAVPDIIVCQTMSSDHITLALVIQVVMILGCYRVNRGTHINENFGHECQQRIHQLMQAFKWLKTRSRLKTKDYRLTSMGLDQVREVRAIPQTTAYILSLLSTDTKDCRWRFCQTDRCRRHYWTVDIM